MSETVEVKRRCVFCGSGKMTREHIYPAWVGALIRAHVGSGIWSSPEYGWRTEDLDVVAKHVCKKCNDTWMSQLEDRAKPILTPMIIGTPLVLRSEHQAAIATWCFKTAIMADFLSTPQSLTEATYREFFELRAPPSNCVIGVAAHISPLAGLSFHPAAGEIIIERWDEGRALAETKVNAVMLTLRVFHFVFQVIRYDDEVLQVDVYKNRLQGVRTIWPLNPEPVIWPPDLKALDDSALAAFAGDDHPFL
jgi:hypothetical protein